MTHPAHPLMHVLLNGSVVPEEEAKVSVFDRGFLYGDGLFETLRVTRGIPFLLSEHLTRLSKGADFLGIPLPLSTVELSRELRRLLQRNAVQEGVLRIQLTRGRAPRGYSCPPSPSPTLIATVHPLSAGNTDDTPRRWTVITSSVRIQPDDPLLAHKTCNRLQNLLARREADAANAHEALILNTRHELAETSSANLFILEKDTLLTPPTTAGALPGITRSLVLHLADTLDLPTREEPLHRTRLPESQGAFLTLSTLGLVGIQSVDDHRLKASGWEDRLRNAYEALPPDFSLGVKANARPVE